MSPSLAKTVRDKLELAKAAQTYPIWIFTGFAGKREKISVALFGK